jgi:hypothetical protein
MGEIGLEFGIADEWQSCSLPAAAPILQAPILAK